jgi:hypothetical protein
MPAGSGLEKWMSVMETEPAAVVIQPFMLTKNQRGGARWRMILLGIAWFN